MRALAPPPGRPLGGTQKPFNFCTDLLVPVGEDPFPPLSGSCLKPVVGQPGLFPECLGPQQAIFTLGLQAPEFSGTVGGCGSPSPVALWEEVGGGVSRRGRCERERLLEALSRV